jgi:transcriptional regulator with XRE-family HTH domain
MLSAPLLVFGFLQKPVKKNRTTKTFAKITYHNISGQAFLFAGRKLTSAMPRKRTLKLPPLDYGNETVGERLAGIRRERGYTQIELAKKIGIIQSLVSDYETDRLRLSAEMTVRFAMALGISTDELVHPKAKKQSTKKPSLKVMRRMEEIEKLPPRRQSFVLSALDSLLKAEAR